MNTLPDRLLASDLRGAYIAGYKQGAYDNTSHEVSPELQAEAEGAADHDGYTAAALSGREAVALSHENAGRIIGAARKRIETAHESHGEPWKQGGRTAINFIEERLNRAYPAAPSAKGV